MLAKLLLAKPPRQRSLRPFASMRSYAGRYVHSRELPVFGRSLSRALTLAIAEAPGLSAVQVTADGSLEGLGEFESQIDNDHAGEAGVILIARLLGLCLALIGEILTLRLVEDVSPYSQAHNEIGRTHAL